MTSESDPKLLNWVQQEMALYIHLNTSEPLQ